MTLLRSMDSYRPSPSVIRRAVEMHRPFYIQIDAPGNSWINVDLAAEMRDADIMRFAAHDGGFFPMRSLAFIGL